MTRFFKRITSLLSVILPNTLGAWIGVFVSALSLIVLIEDAYRLELADYIDQLVLSYVILLEVATRPLSYVVQSVFSFFNLSLELDEGWRYVFVLLMLKIGIDVRIDLRLRRWAVAVLEGVWGLICAFVSAIFVGMAGLESSPIIVVGTTVIGLTAYQYPKSYGAALWARPSGVTFKESVRYYQIHYTLGMFVTGILALIISYLLFLERAQTASVFGLLLFVFLLGVYAIFSASLQALKVPLREFFVEYARLERSFLGKCILATYVLVFLAVSV